MGSTFVPSERHRSARDSGPLPCPCPCPREPGCVSWLPYCILPLFRLRERGQGGEGHGSCCGWHLAPVPSSRVPNHTPHPPSRSGRERGESDRLSSNVHRRLPGG